LTSRDSAVFVSIANALPAEQLYGGKGSVPTTEYLDRSAHRYVSRLGARYSHSRLETNDMKFTKKLSLLLSLTAALALSAHAQDAKAKFTLPHDAQIGETVLTAGQYTVTLSLDGITKAMITPVDRDGQAMFALPMSTDSSANCKATSLSMQRDGADWNVRSICFADAQIALYFAAPGVKTALASAAPAPVAITGSR